jgi:hypothetical protein
MQSFAGLARKAGLRASDLEATENPREVQVQKLLSEYQAAVAALASCENGEKEGIKVKKRGSFSFSLKKSAKKKRTCL